MNIQVTDQIALTDIRPADKAAYLQHLNDREIYEKTLRIPYPYTEADADAWLQFVAGSTKQQGQPIHWAIRTADDTLIGGCGLDDLQVGKPHRAEIGYWLARPFWGRGIMTAVVRRACEHAFTKLGLVKVTAHVFAGNLASRRVLQKCAFVEEGFLRKHYFKDGRFIDAHLYVLLRET
jgi:RimJ/RimL family protein N-acetyltransferase